MTGKPAAEQRLIGRIPALTGAKGKIPHSLVFYAQKAKRHLTVSSCHKKGPIPARINSLIH